MHLKIFNVLSGVLVSAVLINLMVSYGRLNLPCKAVSPATGIPTIHTIVTLTHGENDSYQRYPSGTTYKMKVHSSVDYW